MDSNLIYSIAGTFVQYYETRRTNLISLQRMPKYFLLPSHIVRPPRAHIVSVCVSVCLFFFTLLRDKLGDPMCVRIPFIWSNMRYLWTICHKIRINFRSWRNRNDVKSASNPNSIVVCEIRVLLPACAHINRWFCLRELLAHIRALSKFDDAMQTAPVYWYWK